MSESGCQHPSWHAGENMAQLRDNPLICSSFYRHMQGARSSVSSPQTSTGLPLEPSPNAAIKIC